MKKYAIIGFGGLGKKHFLNLLQLEKQRGDIELCAICNSSIEAITQNITINIGAIDISSIDFTKYHLYTDYKEMIEKEELDFVIITLPSHLHHPVGKYCLEHGIDVFMEKPMAITLEECRDLIDTANQNGRKMMVGQVLRFFPDYKYLKNLVDSGIYGKPVKAEFTRRSALPTWSFENWLLDDTKSGGCIVDMHVHDVDVMMWLFGKPDEFYALSTNSRTKYESVFGLYKYPDLSATITADWGIPSTFEFKATFNVTFEKAYVECIGGQLVLYTDDKREVVKLEETDPYVDEVVEFIDGVVCGKPFSTASTESVYDTMKLVFAEKAKI